METGAYKPTTMPAQTTITRFEGPGIGLDREFPRTTLGILLIGAVVSAVACFICGSVFPWSLYGGSFVVFQGSATTIVTSLMFFLYLFRVLPKIPGPIGLVILIYLGIVVALSLISFGLSAANSNSGVFGGATIAGAIFSAITLCLHAVVGFLMFRRWQLLRNYFHRGECGYIYTQTRQTSEEVGGASPAYGNY